jgi:acetolactate synthase-1/2/3 large subunit
MTLTPSPQTSKIADQVMATLKRYGVEYVFGIPGNDVLELLRASKEQGMRFVLGKSEPSCAFMADAIWQLTGKPAVLITALGPGISNALSGIAGALQERSALIILSGDAAHGGQGIYTHQIIDHLALARPVTKYAQALNPLRAGQQTALAADLALAFPPGPVLLNISADDSRARAVDGQSFFAPRQPQAALMAAPQAALLRQQLASAHNPLALIGRGALLGKHTATATRQWVSEWKLPAITTFKAKGVIDERSSASLGALGLSPVVDALQLEVISQADLLVLIGFDPIELRDGWIDAWDQEKKVISLDWGSLHHRQFALGIEIHGDLPGLLQQTLPQQRIADQQSRLQEWQLHRERQQALLHVPRTETAISPAALLLQIDQSMQSDWQLTVDVGAHRILANHVLHCHRPNQLLQSNGFCCMGYALPAAIAAALVNPQRPTVAIIGDGCLLMSLGELALAAEHDLPLVVVVLNDAHLSLIQLKQQKAGLPAYGTNFSAPRFDQIATGFGARGVFVDRLDAFTEAFSTAITSRQFTLIDVRIDPAEYLQQM